MERQLRAGSIQGELHAPADWLALFVRFAFWPLIFALLALLELL